MQELISNFKFLLISISLSIFAVTIMPIIDEDVGYSINIFTFVVVPGVLVIVFILLTRKLRQNHSPFTRAILLLTIAAASFFIAEQIWIVFEDILEIETFPSVADAFYLAVYPVLLGFVILYIKAGHRKISRDIIYISIFISTSVLIPTVIFTYELNSDELLLEKIIALSYPIGDAILLGAVTLGFLVFWQEKKNYFWILMMAGTILLLVADTFYLHLSLTDEYSWSNPVSLLWILSYVMWIFAARNFSTTKNQSTEIVSSNFSFENKHRIVLIGIIVSAILIMSIFQTNYYLNDESDTTSIIISHLLLIFMISIAGIIIFSMLRTTIKTKLIVSTILIVIIFVSPSVYIVEFEQKIIDVSDYNNFMSIPSLITLEEISINTEKMHRSIHGFALNHEHAKSEYTLNHNILHEKLREYEELTWIKNSHDVYFASPMMQKSMLKFISSYELAIEKYDSLAEKLFLLDVQDSENQEEIQQLFAGMDTEIDTVHKILSENKSMEVFGMEEQQAKISSYLETQRFLKIITILFVIVMSVMMIAIVSKNMKKQMNMINKITEEISNGKFDSHYTILENDEFAKIGKRVISMGQKLSENQDERIKAERLKSIGELASRLAHDIRNPLSIIKTTNEVIRVKTEKDEYSRITKNMDSINKAVERMSYQIDSVLDFIRTKPLVLGEHSMQNIIEKTLETINVPKNVTIDLKKNDAKITCDLQRISIVFTNLITNAIQVIDKNSGQITIRIKENDDQVSCEIIDSGNGIPEDKIDKVFEPLFTTKQTGTGLGLASCKSIIEQHNGTISIHNNPTTFTITLPKIITVQEVSN